MLYGDFMPRKRSIEDASAEIFEHPFIDNMIKSLAHRARQQYGSSSVFLGSQSESLLIGIPMIGGYEEDASAYPNCLPMEFLLSQSVFPLGLVTQLVGKTAVGKSALLAEISRWFFLANGMAVILESETKFNPQWYSSILGKRFFDSTTILRCQSLEDWQRKLTWAINTVKSDMTGTKTSPGPGRVYPVLFGVDGLTSKSSEESQEKIFGSLKQDGLRGSGQGYAGRGFSTEALSLTKYFRSLPQEMDCWPFSFVGVNHVKYRKSEMGFDERHKPGGEHLNFQESFEIEVSKHGGARKIIECKDWEGFALVLSCEKNSFGPTGRKITTRIRWWHEQEGDNLWRQVTVWDWDWATVHLLWSLLLPESRHSRLRSELKAADIHIDCPKTSDVENLAWSKTLGMTREDARPWSEVGAMIRKNPEVVSRIRTALKIVNRPVMQKRDYLAQIQSLSEKLV